MSYVGLDRRQRPDRRGTYAYHGGIADVHPERRQSDRRQAALATVVVGMNAQDMAVLVDFWKAHEKRKAFNDSLVGGVG